MVCTDYLELEREERRRGASSASCCRRASCCRLSSYRLSSCRRPSSPFSWTSCPSSYLLSSFFRPVSYCRSVSCCRPASCCPASWHRQTVQKPKATLSEDTLPSTCESSCS